jgi:hypothetical protein
MNRKVANEFLWRNMALFDGGQGNLKCHLDEQFLKNPRES